jgi:hypothetical protein
MRRFFRLAGLCLAPLLGLSVGLAYGSERLGRPPVPPPPPVEKAPAEGHVCGSYGTTIDFLDTPKEAAARAIKEEKLVFILHVSGNLEDPRFL